MSAWRRKATQVQNLLAEGNKLDQVKAGRDDLDRLMNNLYGAVEEYEVTSEPEPELQGRLQKIEEDNHGLHRDITATLLMVEDSKSGSSGASSTSSKEPKRSADITSLKVEIKHLDEEVKKERELARIQGELNQLKIEKKMQLAEAKRVSLENIQAREAANTDHCQARPWAKVEEAQHENYCQAKVRTEDPSIHSDSHRLLDTLSRQLLAGRLPHMSLVSSLAIPLSMLDGPDRLTRS